MHTIALVEDHALVALGFQNLITSQDDLTYVGGVVTVKDLPALGDVDLVVLDLRLGDGTRPSENIAAIHGMGAHVLIYTSGENRALVQEAAKAGALGLVRKSAEPQVLLDAIRQAAAGGDVFGTDWAAAIDTDSGLADAGLTVREREVLAGYASGETAASVAESLGVERETIAFHVTNIRKKYQNAGRPVKSRIDLYKRATEDGLI